MVARVVFDATTVKTIGALAIAALGYMFPAQTTQSAWFACSCLLVLDTITGVAAAVRTNQRITSAKFSRFLVKFLAYSAVVAVVAFATHAIPGTLEIQGFLTSGAIAGIAITEGISVLENVELLGVIVPFGIDRWLRERADHGLPSKLKQNEYPTDRPPSNDNTKRD
jgi:phage-related holin